MKRPDGDVERLRAAAASARSPAAAHFTETFITEARAPLFNVIGGLNNGWRVTMTTLGNERGGNATTQHVQYQRQFWDGWSTRPASWAATTTRSSARSWPGRTPTPRSCAIQGLRTLSEVVARKEPGPGASINKMFWSEYAQRIGEWIMNLRGAEAMIRRRRRRATRLDRWQARLPRQPVGDDLGRHRPGPAQHRRRAGARACPRSRAPTTTAGEASRPTQCGYRPEGRPVSAVPEVAS